MPDYNKGDFTQQGVAGHVNANLRLNEKRLVNIDLTSNEEAEGCTISGAVTDLLNNEVYPIGAGVSGNIEITENGENINVAQYATATVNVAGGGEEETLTFTMIAENDYTTELDNGDNIIFNITSTGVLVAAYADSITVNINNNDVVLEATSPGSVTYRNEAGIELSTGFHGNYMIFPEAGTYHIKASITLTGKPVEVDNNENGFILAEVGDYKYLYFNNTFDEVVLGDTIIADKIVPFSPGE